MSWPNHPVLRKYYERVGPGKIGPSGVAGDVQEVHLAHVELVVQVELETLLDQSEGAGVVFVVQKIPEFSFGLRFWNVFNREIGENLKIKAKMLNQVLSVNLLTLSIIYLIFILSDTLGCFAIRSMQACNHSQSLNSGLENGKNIHRTIKRVYNIHVGETSAGIKLPI